MIEESGTENSVERTVIGDVANIVEGEPEIRKVHAVGNILTFLDIEFASLYAQGFEPGSSKFNAPAAFEAAEVHNRLAGDVSGKGKVE